MPKAEGRMIKWDDESHVQPDYLELIPYHGEKQLITYETEELSAVCPFSGLPDYGYLRIEYVPKKHIIELKSLKYYLISFRNVGIYQEMLTSRIFSDLKKVLKPEHLLIETIYNTRGGIDTTCRIETKK